MKTLYHKLIVFIFITFLLPFFGGVGSLTLKSFSDGAGGLYAQDPELFNHTWYLEKVVENNTDHFPPDQNFITELYIYPDGLHFTNINCNQGWGFDNISFDSNNPFFTLPDGPIFIGDECTNSSYSNYIELHNNIYFSNNSFANNPYNYTLEAIDDYHELIIENGNGDWAVYNSKLLSNPSFNQTGFSLYPNPVNETLYIKNTFNHVVQASIYDINGKLLHAHNVTNNNTSIDVKSLNQELYFVVIESETGERISKRFIKK